jgi:hypothetical protein
VAAWAPFALTASLLILLLVPSTSWAAGGWYLLLPPRGEYDEHAKDLSDYTIQDSKPLSQWAQQGAYDSASECEAARRRLVQTEQADLARASEEHQKALREGADPVVVQAHRLIGQISSSNVRVLMAGRCIRSDDPRLGQ